MNRPFEKHTCAGCHFFIRTHIQRDGKAFALEISAVNRAKAKTGDLCWQREAEALSCYKGVWDEGLGVHETSKTEFISHVKRSGRCYYFAYQPGMLLPTAEKLQEARPAKLLEGQKYRLAIYGLVLAAIGLAAKVLLGL